MNQFDEILYLKSEVKIKDGKFIINKTLSETNQIGSKGRNDLIRRQDAVALIFALNSKLNNVIEKYCSHDEKLAGELREATQVLDYAVWGIRELDPVKVN